jgi:hypothetical protein
MMMIAAWIAGLFVLALIAALVLVATPEPPLPPPKDVFDFADLHPRLVYHGGGYHALAAALSLGGAAKVVLPNLRGHYQSAAGAATSAIGQLEDDFDDLIQFLRAGPTRPATAV